jgi:hypothetical protein
MIHANATWCLIMLRTGASSDFPRNVEPLAISALAASPHETPSLNAPPPALDVSACSGLKLLLLLPAALKEKPLADALTRLKVLEGVQGRSREEPVEWETAYALCHILSSARTMSSNSFPP